ncbi:MAG: translation initiation factor IF-2 [Candidatus Shapirobacteria bacterium]|nr:translation initiation factor IF-2 [Candidatus Shapirobacteria bacterium]
MEVKTTIKLRPPIVAVMGHIDHGKTSLLDKIRSTNIWRKEAGGITQHIGAYQAVVKQKDNQDKLITFIDTPGHAAFINMRARGAKVTDLVVLVIAATEGVMPQTKECLDHIKRANLPFIVAMNKMDLDGALPDKVKGQLVELGYTPEEYGGQIPIIPVSAKTGKGIEELLELILLHAEIMELTSEVESPMEAVVIESRLDKAKGPVASAIVRKGILHLGDIVYAENISGKVKALVDFTGKNIKEAPPSTPVEILGFEKPPVVGSVISLEKTEYKPPENKVEPIKVASNLEEEPKLRVIIKADVEGTLEALMNSFSDDVQVILSGVGPVLDNDIFIAETSKAEIFAFNVQVPKFIQKLAENQKVKIFESKIIYEIIENIQTQVLKLLEPTIDENITGEGEIIAEFKIEKVRIAGIHCTKGELNKGDMIHLKRDGKIIKDTKIEGIHQAKQIIEKVKVGAECGITFKPYVDFKLNDVIIAYNKS